jgi:phenylacetate-CoA ligase
VTTHLLEDVQVWETIDPQTRKPQAHGERGLTVCTNLNSESSPQLRFLVGDYATFDRGRCRAGAPTCAPSARSPAAPTT